MPAPFASLKGESPTVSLPFSGTKKHGDIRFLSIAAIKKHGQSNVEELWCQFFADPSQWWDNTQHKVNPKYPDFKHKKKGVGLWVDNRSTPLWVKREVASLTPGSVSKSLFSWNVLIDGCVKSNKWLDALKLYNEMQAEGAIPDTFTFVRVIKACASVLDLEEGRRVHAHVIGNGCMYDVAVGNTLVDMYAKCGSVEDAERVFHSMAARNVVSWTAMLAGYVKCEQGQKALEFFSLMQKKGLEPNTVTYIVVLNACASIMALEEGRHVHEQVIESGCEADVFVATTLVNMYAKCGSIEDAESVFHKMCCQDVVACNAMLTAYVKCEQGKKALEQFALMQKEGIRPNTVTYVVALNACASLMAVEEGRHVHAQVIETGCKSDISVGNALVDMYAKCGCIEDAESVFYKMPTRNVVSWTAMLAGYVKCQLAQKALEQFVLMQKEGVKPNPITYVVVLNACASIVALAEGRRVHGQAIESGCSSDPFVATTLVDMYAKCGSIEDAESVFHKMPCQNVISCNAMLTGYVKCEQGQKALEQFAQMQKKGVKPNIVTYVFALNACASIMALEEGRRVHMQVIERGFESDVFVANTLVDMYAKCGSIEDAESVFHKMPTRDVVSWSIMLAGYVKCEHGQKALEQFVLMQKQGVNPNTVTYVVLLNACASIMALEEGRHVHWQVIESGCELDVYVATTLVDMYAKCGSIADAESVFHKMPTRDVVSWNAMLGGFAMHGQGKEALQLFQEMCQTGVKMSTVTFICLLSACSHGGLVDEGLELYESMGPVYGILQTRDHYICMIDLLGRAGRLDEAEELLRSDPKVSKDCVALMALLGACRHQGNVEMGERVAQQLFELRPCSASSYVLLSNIYGAAGQWDSRDRVQEMRMERGARKVPGRTWIEVDKQVHSFVVDDKVHPQIEEIHAELQVLSEQMKEAGYIPDTRFVLDNVEEKEKASHLCRHSEKLAIAFGLIKTAPGTPLRIYKNLRVCVDCHTATKFMTKIVGREIFVRDANRFHHFKDSQCSCRDYW